MTPGNLPLLVGEPVRFCPVGAAHRDPETLYLARLVPRPGNPGLFNGVPRAQLTPRLRAALALAEGWLADFGRVGQDTGEEVPPDA